MTVLNWLSRWWHEGNGDSEPVKKAEDELLCALRKRTYLSLSEAAIREHEAVRVRQLADSAVKTANETLAIVKRENE